MQLTKARLAFRIDQSQYNPKPSSKAVHASFYAMYLIVSSNVTNVIAFTSGALCQREESARVSSRSEATLTESA